LLKTFDSIYVLDLHGNTKKKEITPEGGKDENVFDIQPGVSVVFGIRTNNTKTGLAKLYYSELWGLRKEKFKALNTKTIELVNWIALQPKESNFLFVPSGSKELESEYEQGYQVCDLFEQGSTGVFTLGDGFIVAENKDELNSRITKFLEEDVTEVELNTMYSLGKNYAKWALGNKAAIEFDSDKLVKLTYRPFDYRYTYFDNKLVWRPRSKVMSNLASKDNIAMAVGRQGQVVGSMDWNVVFVTKYLMDLNCFYRGGEQVYPLYVMGEDGKKTLNMRGTVVSKIQKCIGDARGESIFDYTYAILHSPKYRKKYDVFLKKDYPRVPYPQDKQQFKELVSLGKKLREIHLLESPKVSQYITSYPIQGTDIIEKISYKEGSVYINKEQYFGNVPEVAWNFYIGGYQPAQKWLKDRKGRTLTNEDIEHYQKIIVALTETDRIMKEIDKIFP